LPYTKIYPFTCSGRASTSATFILDNFYAVFNKKAPLLSGAAKVKNYMILAYFD